MAASVLVSGRLVRDPARKMSKAAKPFVTAVLREGDGEAVTWWKLLCFSEDGCDELLSLKAGDRIAASGAFKAEVYEKAGAQRISHTVFADRVISTKRQKRDRAAQRRSAVRTAGERPVPPLPDDEVPW